MGIELEETLSRELHEVAGRLAVPPMPALPAHDSSGGRRPSSRTWVPPVLVAAATIVVLAVVGLLAAREGGHDLQPAPSPGPTVSQTPSRAADPDPQPHRGKIQDPDGSMPRTGPGVTVTLADAPEKVIGSTELDPNVLLVHQQDIRAVMKAMWEAGATAVTVQGQRVVSASDITCEGDTVIIDGVPYPQPFRISAVGDQDALLAAIDGDPYLTVYRQQAADPAISVGWDLRSEPSITAPAYDGVLDLDAGPRRD
ncbi:DUF881 domain-containing protein [Nocardioides mangrovi]|uniref:DUF881 domain-containing protein n=1 Tax=Nocardioides mangrovi TaxID=2874580 RepID=A0ABS7UAA3_9ACTN|nr:DUF881 domain-containing protein [Nocardioides mangrovi]MBZ5737919.1 DUF881 domain-containing protein [Nocardioides mangrovi]